MTVPRVFNFSPGPAVLPLPVLEEIQRDLLALPGVGVSILEIGHRTETFLAMLGEAEANLRTLLGIPDNYRVLFLQGGARLQFSMIPMNLLRGQPGHAEYLVTGTWGSYALKEAQREGDVRVVWNGKATNYDRLPEPGEVRASPEAAYFYFCSNETIQGVQFPGEPPRGDAQRVPLVCDSSSDFLSRPVDVARYGLIYACAQKNAGPAGVTVVILRDELLARSQDNLPGMLSYQTQAAERSLHNTAPVFGIYVVLLVTRWLLDQGGLTAIAERNRQKAELLYAAIDRSEGFYRGHARRDCRSQMNVTFRLPDEALEKQFLAQAEARHLCQLAGHRSVGGLRASIYNAMPHEGVQRLAEFMDEFRVRHAETASARA